MENDFLANAGRPTEIFQCLPRYRYADWGPADVGISFSMFSLANASVFSNKQLKYTLAARGT